MFCAGESARDSPELLDLVSIIHYNAFRKRQERSATHIGGSTMMLQVDGLDDNLQPNEQSIDQALRLMGRGESGFMILSNAAAEESPFMQSSFSPEYQFYVEYSKGRRLYGISHVPFEAARDLLLSYLRGEDWWKSAVKWKLSLDLNTNQGYDISKHRFVGEGYLPRSA
jgi:hypothetical protein